MTTPKPTRGGARQGAGAPIKPNRKRWFSVYIEQNKAESLGGLAAVKKYAQSKLDEL